jgi:hypothetical protein
MVVELLRRNVRQQRASYPEVEFWKVLFRDQ